VYCSMRTVKGSLGHSPNVRWMESEGRRSTRAREVMPAIPSRDGGRNLGERGAAWGEERVSVRTGENAARSRGRPGCLAGSEGGMMNGFPIFKRNS
jgi:hypothetical protein